MVTTRTWWALTAAALVVLLAGCGFGYPWPEIAAGDGEHHVVLAIGDSLMGNTLQVLPRLMPDTTIIGEHRDASGLLTPIDGMRPADFVDSLLDEHPEADTLFVEWAGACVNCAVTYGSEEFYDAWFAEGQEIVDRTRERGLTVVWAIPPPPPPGETDFGYYRELVAQILSFETRTFAATNRLVTANWWDALAATDGFLGRWDDELAWSLFGGPLEVHKVRYEDRVHLTTEGAFRTSWWSLVALREAWGMSSPRSGGG